MITLYFSRLHHFKFGSLAMAPGGPAGPGGPASPGDPAGPGDPADPGGPAGHVFEQSKVLVFAISDDDSERRVSYYKSF